MKILRNIFVLYVVTIGYTASVQANCDYKQMITKIDSISKARNIELGKVSFNRVISVAERTSTYSYALTKKQKFSFDEQFLVIGNSYFNIDKLLFFFIREDYIDFYFQGY